MNPWMVLGILVAATSDRSRESVELQSLRKSVDDLKHQLAAATARNAFRPPPQPEPQPSWCEPTAEPGEPEPQWAEPAEQPTESSAEGEFYPGEFVQSIIDGEADYVWRMNDRTVEDYGG
jgi:hypothetical protein